MAYQELYFPLATGIDRWTPETSPNLIFVKDMLNCSPRSGRIVTAEKPNFRQKLPSGKVFSLNSCTGGDFSINQTYAICSQGIHKYNTNTGYFNNGRFYTFDSALTLPVTAVNTKWGLFITSPELDLTNVAKDYVRVLNSQFDTGTGNLRARYMIEAKSHMMIANTVEDGVRLPYRVRWSDVSSPGIWSISNKNGADYIDIEFAGGPITGMTYQKGYVVVYELDSIWIGEYNSGVYFKFEPAFTQLGNRFHYSVIHAGEMDFFIGYDNFYKMNGLEVTPIGDKIWRFFLESSSNVQDGTEVPGFWNPYDNEVFWNYTDTNNNAVSLVFNYRLNEWSIRSSNSITSHNKESRNTPRMSGDANGIIYVKDYGYGEGFPRKLEGEGFIETSEVFLDHTGGVKEISEVKVLYTQVGNPNLIIQVGVRDDQTKQVKWGEAITGDQITGDKMFYTRDQPLGHYVRFKISWTNTEFDYIDEVLGIAMKVRQPGMDVER